MLKGLAKKWPEMVVKWFIVTHRLGESVFSSKKNWKFFFRKYFNLFVENPALVLLWRNVMTERTQKQMHVVQVSKPLVATPTLFHNVVKNFIELGFKPFYSPFSLLKTFGFFLRFGSGFDQDFFDQEIRWPWNSWEIPKGFWLELF